MLWNVASNSKCRQISLFISIIFIDFLLILKCCSKFSINYNICNSYNISLVYNNLCLANTGNANSTTIYQTLVTIFRTLWRSTRRPLPNWPRCWPRGHGGLWRNPCCPSTRLDLSPWLPYVLLMLSYEYPSVVKHVYNEHTYDELKLKALSVSIIQICASKSMNCQCI